MIDITGLVEENGYRIELEHYQIGRLQGRLILHGAIKFRLYDTIIILNLTNVMMTGDPAIIASEWLEKTSQPDSNFKLPEKITLVFDGEGLIYDIEGELIETGRKHIGEVIPLDITSAKDDTPDADNT